PHKDQEYFCDGMAEELINTLTKIEKLQVASRTSAFQFKGKAHDIHEIGKKLKVQTVLEGSVRKARNRLRITAQLVSVADGYHVWSEKYDRDMEDIFAIQDEISLAIVDKLKIKLLGREKESLVKRYTDNIEAYRAYLEGRFWWNKRSQEGFAKANLLFNKSIGIDPNYALAYAGLAECYCMLSMHLAKPEPIIRQGRIAAEKALSIDETLAEAHAALGWIKFAYDWDWLGAERSFKQAIQLNPRYATAYNCYAAFLSILNRHEEAIRYMTQAQEYDPGSAIINRDLGIVYAWAGDFEKAINQLQLTIDMDPDFSPAYFLMGVVHLWLKKYDLAIEYFKKVRDMTGDFFDIIGSLSYTYAKSGQKEAALSELKKLEDISKSQDTRASEFCLIHTGLGHYDQAFKWLDIACKNREFAVVLLLGCESELWFENLLTDPRFKEVLTRIGIEK
ncbi:MAG: tetratricopeptide repeat protein, partial [Candidatus Zixiibacteriota bacterium]